VRKKELLIFDTEDTQERDLLRVLWETINRARNFMDLADYAVFGKVGTVNRPNEFHYQTATQVSDLLYVVPSRIQGRLDSGECEPEIVDDLVQIIKQFTPLQLQWSEMVLSQFKEWEGQSPFKPMQLVKASQPPKGYDQYPWKAGDILLYLGEIRQMPGHVAVVTRGGKIHWGYHDDNFEEPSEEDI
jgi:hypothetical protein